MGKYAIYKKNGSVLTDANGKQVFVQKLTYNGEWMGACNLSVDISNEAPIEFTIGDYIIYRGERFEINYEPGKIKAASRNASGEGFKYNSIVFNSLADELVRSEFLDVVLVTDNEIHYTALPKFSFYVSSMDDIADRLQANMDELYGKGTWHFYTRNKGKSTTNRGCDGDVWDNVYGDGVKAKSIESTSLSISSQTCWDVLGLVNSQFDVNFIVRDRNVFIETVGFTAEHMFKYGKGNGLYEIEESADSGQAVITRMRAYGNTTNMPTRFYAEVGARCFAEVKTVDSKDNTELYYCDLILDLEYSVNEFTERRITKAHDLQVNDYVADNESVAYVTIDDKTTIRGAIRKDLVDTRKSRFLAQYASEDYDNTFEHSKENLSKFVDAVKEGSVLYFTTTAKRSKFPSKNIAYTSDLPNNMAIDRLMLPGFPGESLQAWWDRQDDTMKAWLNPTGKTLRFSTDKYRPYVESPNMDKIGIRPASVFFDSDNEKEGLKDIYPTIEEMEVGGVRIDEIDTGSEESVTDDGVFKDGQTVPNFDIYLKKEIDFDISTLANDDFTINMKDGMCGGRSFKVAAKAKEKDGRWRLRLERANDSGLNLYFPYKDFPISAGDHFVLTGIEMPESYVAHNSETLLKYCIAKLSDNDYTRKTYTPKVDEIYMARQNDEAEADATGATKSIYKTIKEGDLLQFKDEDLGLDARVTIDKLSIKEDAGKIPTYEITLKEEKTVGTIKKMQNQISSIVSGSTGEGGFTNAQIEGMVVSAGKEHFISKTSKDSARGLISFLKGIGIGADYSITELGDAVLRNISGKGYSLSELGDALLREIASVDFNASEQTGYGMKRREDGKYKLSLTDLEVWGKAVFHELEIRKLSYVGGNFLFSPAGSTLDAVQTNPDYYRCYFLADDGEKAVENLWKAGDLALCETFDISEGTYQDVANKRYWRRVLGVSSASEQIIDTEGNVLYGGKKFHWVDLSVTDCESGSDIPEVGDTICCLGSKLQPKARGNAITIKTTGDDAPCFVQYAGIDDYSLADKAVTKLSPDGNVIKGKFYAQDGGKELSETIGELKVESDKVSAKVDASREWRNLVSDSAFRLHSNGYGVAMRDVVLDKETTYTMSAKGTTDQQLTDGGGLLAVFVYNDEWSWSKVIKIKSNATGNTTGSVTFNDVPKKGVYHVAAYAYHESETKGYGNFKPQEQGTFTLDYIQIEEGSVATEWTPNEADAAVVGNLLTPLDGSGWIKASGLEVTTDAFVVDGRHTAVAHLKNTTDGILDMITYPTTVDADSTYVLSMWVKGSGNITSYLYPKSCRWAEDNQGHSTALADGGLDNTLTSSWRKITIRYSTGRRVGNMLNNAAFTDALTGWTTVGGWTTDNDSIDGYAAARMTAYTLNGYGELVQEVEGITKGARYSLQFSSISKGMSVFLMGLTPQNVYVDGKAYTPVSGYEIQLAADTNWTSHVITFVASDNTTPTIRFRSKAIGLRIGKPMLSDGHLEAVFRAKENNIDYLLPARLASGTELWIAGVKFEKHYKATEYNEQTLTVAQLLPTGVDIENKKITATADNFVVQNNKGEVTTTVTADGQLTAGILATMNRGDGCVRAEDGLMSIYNGQGLCNIRFGVDPNSGMMVLAYYDNAGNLLYNLGPGGLENSALRQAVLTEYTAERLGTFFANKAVVGTGYADDVYHQDGSYLVIDSAFKSRLKPNALTDEGYVPVSAMGQTETLYHYLAAKAGNAYVADKANGILNPALAESADNRWFNSKPICVDGDLNPLAKGEYIFANEPLHYGIKNGVRTLAIYAYTFYTDDDGTRERMEIFVE